MHALVILTVFGIIVVGELPDKTFIAELILSTKYEGLPVWVGAAGAMAIHVAIATLAGHLLTYAPKRVVETIVALLFAGGALLLFLEKESKEVEKGKQEAEELEVAGAPSFRKVTALAFGVIFLGEWGDLTQVLMANLTARYHSVLNVAIGSLAGLWATVTLAVLSGRTIVKYVPLAMIRRVAGGVLAIFAVVSAVQAFNS